MKLIINDNRVWNSMIKGAEMALALRDTGSVLVNLNGESPALDQTELPALFDFLKSQNLDVSNITVSTGNPLEAYCGINVVHDSGAFYEIDLFQKNLHLIPTGKKIKYHFGNFISRTTLPRLVIAGHLYANYREKTLQTFHYDHASDYHKTHLGMDMLIHEYGPNSPEFNEAVILLRDSPLLKEAVDTYPILHTVNTLHNLINPCQWYKEIFVDVICETWYQGQNFYITEKFWRAVATKTPFIIQGAQHILTNLKKLGFETFEDYWDEGYQEDPAFHNISEIKKILNALSELPLSELEQKYLSMKELLDHNYRVFTKISRNDIIKVRQSSK